MDDITISAELEIVSPKSVARQGYPLLSLFFNIILKLLAREIEQEKEIKATQIGKQVKLSLFTDDLILYRENQKNPHLHKKLLELINKLDKFSGHKISIQTLVVFLYTNNEWSEKKIKWKVPFTIVSERIKYLKINLNKDVKTCMPKTPKIAEIKNTQIIEKTSFVHGLRDLILLKCLYYTK